MPATPPLFPGVGEEGCGRLVVCTKGPGPGGQDDVWELVLWPRPATPPLVWFEGCSRHLGQHDSDLGGPGGKEERLINMETCKHCGACTMCFGRRPRSVLGRGRKGEVRDVGNEK